LAGYERVNKLFRKEQMVERFDGLYGAIGATTTLTHQDKLPFYTPNLQSREGYPSELTIQPADKSDLPVIAAMHINPSIDKVREIILQDSGSYNFYLDKVKMFHAIEPGGVLVARKNNQIIGFIITTEESNLCHPALRDKLRHQDIKNSALVPPNGGMPLCLGGYPLNFLLRFALKAMLFRYGINKKMLKKLFMSPFSALSRPVPLLAWSEVPQEQRTAFSRSEVPQEQRTAFSRSEVPQERRTGKIWAFIIMKEARRQGLGLKLIDAACDYAIRYDADAICVTVARDNLPALSIYQKTGFRIAGECLESTGQSYYLIRPVRKFIGEDGDVRLSDKLITGLSNGVKQANRAVYNVKTVEQYEANPSIFEPERQAEIKNIITFISAKTGKGIFLDVGCGTGNVLKIARSHFGLTIGVDIAEKLLKEVRKLHPELDLIAADSSRLPFKNSVFDCVSLYGTLHHLFDPSETLGRITALLKAYGYLYTDHDPNWFFGRFYHLYYRLRHRSPGFGSKQEEMAEFHNTRTGGINPELLKKGLLTAGFRDVRVRYRHTTNPTLPVLERLGLLLLKTLSRLMPLKCLYTHFYLICRR
ncbi:MAG: GNAT family N-acetyltransferase, partial [Planctomycetota bacterium]